MSQVSQWKFASMALMGMLALVACGQRTGQSLLVASPIAPDAASSSAGGTLTEALAGPSINGVVPEGQALADESQLAAGGSTTLRVQVKNVNLPDGTALAVTLDFSGVGTIVLSRGEGTMTASLGRFGVSNDQVRVSSGNVTILGGAFFK